MSLKNNALRLHKRSRESWPVKAHQGRFCIPPFRRFLTDSLVCDGRLGMVGDCVED